MFLFHGLSINKENCYSSLDRYKYILKNKTIFSHYGKLGDIFEEGFDDA